MSLEVQRLQCSAAVCIGLTAELDEYVYVKIMTAERRYHVTYTRLTGGNFRSAHNSY